jgi:hypothetical protein
MVGMLTVGLTPAELASATDHLAWEGEDQDINQPESGGT